MHHRPSGPPRTAVLRAALRRSWLRLRSTPLLLAAVVLLIASGVALVAPAAGSGGGRLAFDDAAARHDHGAGADRTPPSGGTAPATDGGAAGATRDRAGGDAAGHHRAGQDGAAQDGAGQGAAPQDGNGAGGKGQNAAGQNAAGQNAAGQDAAGQGAAGQNAAAQGRDRRGDHRRQQAPQAAVPNPNCTLTVPADPTSAAGLATPYRLAATDRRAGACHEANADQSAFVEAAILDPATGAVSIYHPLVIDEGTRPAAAPVPVTPPAGAVVGVWFGFNGDTLTLAGPGAGACVNGLPGSPFGQFAYCNAPAFFSAANAAIAAGKLTVPAPGTGRDGLPCPTSRDFLVVDQDQSDNLATVYRVVRGRLAQDTAATRGGTALSNGSDEGLLARSIDPALGCTPFRAPDLTDGGALTPALALNELSAAAHQADPALTPTSDPMTQVDGRPSRQKTDLYRAGVGMPPLPAGQNPQAYCAKLLDLAPARLARDAALFRNAPAPAGADAANLHDFLAKRFATTLTNLNCRQGGR